MPETLRPDATTIAAWTRALAEGGYNRAPIPGLTDEGYHQPTTPKETPRHVAKAEAAQLGGPGFTK